MTTRSPLLMALAALVLTACAMAMGGPGPARSGPKIPPVIGTATPLPFACALVARQQGGSLALEGRIDTRDALSGTYDLTVRGPGVSIDQAGDMTLSAGTSNVLGQANVTGRLEDLKAAMTVTARGRTVTCPVQGG